MIIKRKHKPQWELWYAWYPVELYNGDRVFLQNVERCVCTSGNHCGDTLYRLPGTHSYDEYDAMPVFESEPKKVKRKCKC